MDYKDNAVLITTIFNQVPDLCMAELIQVADFIQGLKTARKFTTRT